MNASSDCCSHLESDIILVANCNFWVEGVLTFGIGSFGILGNLLSITVLTNKEMGSSTFNHLLIILATVDTLLIIFALLDKSLINAFNINMGNVYNYLFPYFIYPTTNIVLCSSIFMVLSIAFERYLAVCRPYQYRAISNTQTLATRVLKLIIPVFILAVIINIPKFFETEWKEVSFPNSTTNHTVLVIVVTKLRKKPAYINYYVNWFSLLATGVIPMVMLIFLNINIYLKIAATRKKTLVHKQQQQLLSVEKCRKKETELSKRDLKMTMILVAIVLVFFTCHLPRVLLNLHEFFMVSKMISCGISNFCPPIWFLCAINFSHLLLIINSSVNIFIYCLVGKTFRDSLKRKLHCHENLFLMSNSCSSISGKPGNNDNSQMMMTTILTLEEESNNDRTKVNLEPRRDVSIAMVELNCFLDNEFGNLQ